MTRKRFRISKVFELNKPFPIYDGDCPLTQKEASDLLNELYEENQSLKKEIETQNQSILRLSEKIADCKQILK